MEDSLEFCTLGMFIIDEIQYIGSQSPETCVIGGAGTFAACGARLVSGQKNARLVGWTVDVGSDFPPDFRSAIESWQTSCLFREDTSRLCTRAWNGYGPGDVRDFRYLTPKIRLDQDSLSKAQLLAKTFHFVCSSGRALSLARGIAYRRSIWLGTCEAAKQLPLIVWEPVPDLCCPAELGAFQEAVRAVDIVSPNAEELTGFFTSRNPKTEQDQMAKQVLSWGIGPQAEGWLVVRQGSEGCTAYSSQGRFQLRAYHLAREDKSSPVKDVTGGGNAFLGALGMAMGGKVEPPMNVIEGIFVSDRLSSKVTRAKTRNLVGALIYATVAASYVIEQPGMPYLSGDGRGEESWNGDEIFGDRLLYYINRERDHLQRQLEDEKYSASR